MKDGKKSFLDIIKNNFGLKVLAFILAFFTFIVINL